MVDLVYNLLIYVSKPDWHGILYGVLSPGSELIEKVLG
jgi:hypothetical protein